eukprot:m.41977 g.41977  ORF g.41977 m.41977 type:complete len:181 (-) comp11506_c0_seq3:265-807(-)
MLLVLSATPSLRNSFPKYTQLRSNSTQEQRFHENLVVREWVPMDVDMEFRGFVANGALNALSQYNHLAFFPRLAELSGSIVARVREFFATEVRHRLCDHFGSYVIDFGFSVDMEQIFVIELNPFLETTDGAMFSWNNERELLEHGPFEFRFREKVAHGAAALMQSDWRDLLADDGSQESE